MKFVLATKLNMTQLYSNDGRVFPVTVLRANKSTVSRVKSVEKDGYEAVQVQSGRKKREFRGAAADFKPGQEVTVSVFEPGEQVKVSGLSRGRGFAGFIKRHGFAGGPASHGHPHQRVPGSIGQAFPEHVRKGTRMAGRMGGKTQPMTGLTVLAVEPERGLLFVKGSVPGATGSFLKVVTTGKKKPAPKLFVYGAGQAGEEPLENEAKDRAGEKAPEAPVEAKAPASKTAPETKDAREQKTQEVGANTEAMSAINKEAGQTRPKGGK